MKYKKFVTPNNNLSKSPTLSINSLDEIPLPNEIEIQTSSCDEQENLSDTDNTGSTVDVSFSSKTQKTKSPNLLNRLFQNTAIDDILLLAILILLLQEDVPDELLIGLILIILLQK